VNDGWSAIKDALLLRLQILRIEMSFLRARSALALACQRPPQRSSPLLAAPLRDAKLLEAENAPWATALATLIRACVAAEQGSDSAPSLFERADERCRAVDLAAHAAIARRRRGLLLGGATGAALVASADVSLGEMGIASPQRMSGLLAPSRI
jgi:hypothetical protein